MLWIMLGVLVVLWLVAHSAKRKRIKRHPPARPHVPAPAASSLREAPQREPSPARATQPGRWVPQGELLKVAGYAIDNGMVYVGGRLPKPIGYGDENCLINPTLAVAQANPDTHGETMPYWPSYASIQPRARLAYLQWLAGGRSASGVGIGYIFLFFYGLERRIFIDKAEEDYPAITAEVRRLLDIYGDNHSFDGYAHRLLAMLDVFANRGSIRPALRPDLRNGFELPLDVRFYLGLKLKADEPLSAEDALLWIVALPDNYLRTPATRCFEELRALWRVRFTERWPEGLKVRQPKAELKLSYRPASGSFQGSFAVNGLPDVASVHAPVAGLRDLLNACSDELDGYSRFIGKQPEARGAMDAAILLPKALCDSEYADCTVRAKSQVLELLGGMTAAVTSTEKLLRALDLAPDSGMRSVGPILDYIDVGFEPDRRFGAITSADTSQVVLFQCPGQLLPTDLDEFKAARTVVEVAVLAAIADGALDPAQIEVVKDEIRALPGVTEDEQARLLAYAQALINSPPKAQGILNRAGRLDTKKRDRLLQAAIGAILADGRITPDEVKYLERLYKALGLAPEAVYSALHRGVGGRDEPVTVDSGHVDGGAPIPRQPKPAGVGVAIDAARLSRVREQTATVSNLLAEIFVADVSSPAVAPVPAAAATLQGGASSFPGLDPAHGRLLAKLLLGDPMTWTDFEREAQALNLMPDGALDKINDWGFDQFDEVLFEPDENLAMPEHLRPKLQQFETAA